MITKELTNPTHQQTGSVLNLRLLGTLGILASPMIFVEGLLSGFEQHGTTPLIALLEVFYIVGWMSSITGLRWLKATGQGRPGQAILVIQLISLSLAGIWTAYHFLPNPNTTHFLYLALDFFWPLSHLFMIVVGIATLRAKVWTGWLRFTPLLCGLALPLAILAGVLVGQQALGLVFGLGTTAAFALLGYAVRTSQEA